MRKFLNAIYQILSAPFRFIFWVFRGIYRWLAKDLRAIHTFFSEEVEDTPLPDAVARTIEHPYAILEHLDALRKHLLRAILVLAVATGVSFVFNRQILAFLARPLDGGMDSLIAIEVTEPIGTVMRVSLLSGFAIAFPYIALEIWLFIAPGLSRRSRIPGLFAIPIATLFFIGGMAFAYYVMLPAALPFLLNFMGITTIPRPSSYVKFITSLLFWIGIAFEFPLVIYILASLGLIRADMLAQQWRLAIVIIAIAAALITPTIDPVNMALVMGPMILLYFFSIFLAKLAQRSHTVNPAIESQ